MNTTILRKDILRWGSSLFFASLVAFGVLTLTSHAASAVEPTISELRLSSSGLPISLVANPGTTVTTDIRIRNEGAQAETLTTGLMKFGARGEEGRPELLEREAGDNYFDWVSIDPGNFVIQPNEYKTVRVSIDVPAEAAFGYYYAVTFSRASDEKPASGQAVKGSIATLILLEADVPGAKRELQVVEFKSEKKLYEFLPAKLSVKIRNTGNVHAVPHGDVSINQGDKELGRIQLNPSGGYILPGTNRIFTLEWNDGFPRYVAKEEDGKVLLDAEGNAQTQLETDWGKATKFRIGEYTANLLLVYDDGQRDVPIEAAAKFHVIPWKILLVVALIAVLIIIGIVKDIIKLEHFLFGFGKKKSTKRPAAKRSATRKTTSRSVTTRKKPAARKRK